jgi:hypothetical protein
MLGQVSDVIYKRLAPFYSFVIHATSKNCRQLRLGPENGRNDNINTIKETEKL